MSTKIRTRSVSVKGSDTFGPVMSDRTSKILLKILSERDLTERPNRPHPPLKHGSKNKFDIKKVNFK